MERRRDSGSALTPDVSVVRVSSKSPPPLVTTSLKPTSAVTVSYVNKGSTKPLPSPSTPSFSVSSVSPGATRRPSVGSQPNQVTITTPRRLTSPQVSTPSSSAAVNSEQSSVKSFASVFVKSEPGTKEVTQVSTGRHQTQSQTSSSHGNPVQPVFSKPASVIRTGAASPSSAKSVPAKPVSPSVSVKSVNFKSPQPVRPAAKISSPAQSLKPSVSVVKTVTSTKSLPSQSLRRDRVTSNFTAEGTTTSKPAVKIASFAKPNKQSTQERPPKEPASSRSGKSTPRQASSSSEKSDGSDEDDILVYMQFDTQLDCDLLEPHTAFKMIGVDTDKPILQLGSQIYQGDWNDMVGTAVFFEEDKNLLPGDPIFTKNPSHTLKYHSKTRKCLQMSRIFITPKEPDPNGDPIAIDEAAKSTAET